MKNGLRITKAFLIIFILVSTVSLLPVVNAEVTVPKYDLSKLRVIKNQLIEKLGEEKYQEIETEVHAIIDKQLLYSAPVDFDSPLYELLKEIAVIIVAVMVLLFGNNPVGVGLGAAVCVVLLCIPVLLVSVGMSIRDVISILPDYFGGDISGIIEQFGIIGLLIIFILAIPLLAVILPTALAIDTVVTWFILMTELIWYAQPD